METFGPNTDAVNGLIERAARLTNAEAKELAAAWYISGEAAWDAAWEAAWIAGGAKLDAARRAAQHAAWEAAWFAGGAKLDAAWVTARAAAEDAALAAVVRDLISDEDYQALAGPWESVMGPVFKEDE